MDKFLNMANRYWVGYNQGHTGDWNDPMNWSNTPSGIPGFSVPGPDDDAYIDTRIGGVVRFTETALLRSLNIFGTRRGLPENAIHPTLFTRICQKTTSQDSI